MKRGWLGNGETAATAYAISPESVGFWQTRLTGLGLDLGDVEQRFGAEVISFDDPDGLRLELIVNDGPTTCPYWANGPIPAPHALLRGQRPAIFPLHLFPVVGRGVVRDCHGSGPAGRRPDLAPVQFC
jgi:catechol 2,3-dioxygenase-like lactoylglutathione lyase family enzyme